MGKIPREQDLVIPSRPAIGWSPELFRREEHEGSDAVLRLLGKGDLWRASDLAGELSLKPSRVNNILKWLEKTGIAANVDLYWGICDPFLTPGRTRSHGKDARPRQPGNAVRTAPSRARSGRQPERRRGAPRKKIEARPKVRVSEPRKEAAAGKAVDPGLAVLAGNSPLGLRELADLLNRPLEETREFLFQEKRSGRCVEVAEGIWCDTGTWNARKSESEFLSLVAGKSLAEWIGVDETARKIVEAVGATRPLAVDDVSAAARLLAPETSKILTRLRHAGHVMKVSRSLWVLSTDHELVTKRPADTREGRCVSKAAKQESRAGFEKIITRADLPPSTVAWYLRALSLEAPKEKPALSPSEATVREILKRHDYLATNAIVAETGLKPAAANKALKALETDKIAVKLRRGFWCLAETEKSARASLEAATARKAEEERPARARQAALEAAGTAQILRLEAVSCKEAVERLFEEGGAWTFRSLKEWLEFPGDQIIKGVNGLLRKNTIVPLGAGDFWCHQAHAESLRDCPVVLPGRLLEVWFVLHFEAAKPIEQIAREIKGPITLAGQNMLESLRKLGFAERAGGGTWIRNNRAVERPDPIEMMEEEAARSAG